MALIGSVGMIATFGGLVLLAVLLTTISDFFAEQQRQSNEGRDPVVEASKCFEKALKAWISRHFTKGRNRAKSAAAGRSHRAAGLLEPDEAVLGGAGDLRGELGAQHRGDP